MASIIRVCSIGWQDTYAELYTPEARARIISEFYNEERIVREERQSHGNLEEEKYVSLRYSRNIF